MKKIFNLKQKGFTLVEMLGVIIVLAFLSFLVSETIINNVKNTNKKLEVVATDLIISSAREYVELNPNLFPKVLNKSYYISFETLKQNNLITEDMLPKIDTIDTLKSKYVLVIYNGNNYTYDLVEQFSIMVKINPNGGTYNDSTDIYSFEELASSTIKLKTPKRSGYIFDRWVADVEDVVIDKNNITLTEQTVTLTAEWVEGTFEYAYSEDGEQTFIVPKTGYYKLETWGAQGGSYSDTIIGGYGGYSTGIIYLEKGQTLYINVGESGVVTTTKAVVQIDGGYNGGGYATGSTDKYVGSGGGATHIALSSGLLSNFSDNLYDLLIVAGGGGGSSYQDSSSYGYGGVGGGILGGDGTQVTTATWTNGTGGSQLNGGTGKTSGSFGAGGSITEASGTGGGGGYYGGGSGQYYFGAGGGSGYIGNSKLTFKYMYCYNCEPSDEVSTKTYSTSTDVSETPTSNYAKKGNGFAKITYNYEVLDVEVEAKGSFAGTDITINILASNELSNNNKYKYYVSKSNTELVGGLWKDYVPGKSFSISGVSGRFYLWIYPISDVDGNIADDMTDINNPYVKQEFSISYTKEYAYSEDGEQTFIVPKTGYYKLEAWGAQGGGALGGKGAYTTGVVYLEKDIELYVYVGGQGINEAPYTGGYNGGGNGKYKNEQFGYGGGGATDFRYNSNSLNDRIMVAAGGGGSGENIETGSYGGYGGALTGGNGYDTYTSSTNGYNGTGATQTAGGYAYMESGCGVGSFGLGSDYCDVGWGGAGGGGGYYGGGGSNRGHGGGGGGSSYISGHTGCTSGNINFINTEMKAGNESMPTQDGTSTMTGNTGNGLAKITYLGEILKLKIKTEESVIGTDVTINITTTTDLSKDNKYQYYISTSNTELVGGSWKNYTLGESFTVNGTNGRYFLWVYPLSDINGNIADEQTDIQTPYVKQEIIVTTSIEYVYSNNYEEFKVPTSGYYKLEAWGAQGGKYSSYVPGNGAYTSGYVYLEKDEIIYINVGGVGTKSADTSTYTAGGYNGGGSANYQAGTGGGATDFRYSANTTNDRIMVAAGGGGTGRGVKTLTGGGGGSLIGLPGGNFSIDYQGRGMGGTQIAGGAVSSVDVGDTFTVAAKGTFGTGGKGGWYYNSEGSYESGGGGGGGYYGGSGGNGGQGGGGGGSSYISGYGGAIAITSSTDVTKKCATFTDETCSQHYSGKIFINGIMHDGSETMPTHDGTSTMTGNSGDGFARITYIGETLPEIDESTKEFAYQNGRVHIYTVPTSGYYKLEAWGAEGGKYSTYVPGKGAYTSGYVYLEKDEKLYVTVGGAGESSQNKSSYTTGGYNGGGTANYQAGTGGGATDFRYSANTTNDRIMVAAGGGGTGYGSETLTGGSGGSLIGLYGGNFSDGYPGRGQGGTQTSGGAVSSVSLTNSFTAATKGTFGTGGKGGWYDNGSYEVGGGGGGGYYGGSGGNGGQGGGGGGSSYISGYGGAIAITSSTDATKKCATFTDETCSQHYSGKIFTNGIMHDGTETMPTHDGTGKMTGNSGNGYAKITYIGETLSQIDESTKEFAYQNGRVHVYKVPKTGYYKLEAWGASGGAYSTYVPGKGAYTSGMIYLEKGEIIYVTVGGAGVKTIVNSLYITGGYNGGGSANYQAGTGGGATDFRYASGTLNDRIMVAAGGGGTGYGSSNLKGGSGGALTGIAGGHFSSGYQGGGNGGTQIEGGALSSVSVGGSYAAGVKGTFGTGGKGGWYTSGDTIESAGGGAGGYYGGAGGDKGQGGGGGGSSYISGYKGSISITSSTDATPKSGCTTGTTDINCSYHYSGKVFTDTEMKAGNETMPTQAGTSTMTGNTGNGFAKITYIGETIE